MNSDKRITNWINHILSEISQLYDNKGHEILNECGRSCSENSALFQGAVKIRSQNLSENDDTLFNAFKSQYYNSDRITKKQDTITLIFEKCTCPLVKKGVNNSFLCNCTTGYSKNIFETLFGKKVVVILEKSILRGDTVCRQIIRITE
jgi:predicted hydrocarbon binding protein